MTAPDIREVPALDPDPLYVTSVLCPACHHADHDPGSCPECPRCELHTDEALGFVLRIEPELLAEHGFTRGRSSFRWYLLASFVTGLLLGAAVARVVGL